MRKRRSQAPAARLAGRPMVFWLAGGALMACGLVAVAMAAAKVDVPVIGKRIEQTLGQEVAGAALAILFAILFAGCVRNFRLRLLAWQPGPIDVAELAVAAHLDDGERERLSLEFRGRVAALHLANAGPQPGVAPATSFVDLFADDAGKGLPAFVGNLLRAAWPAHAYRVQATLVTRESPPVCGVSVEVLMLPGQATPPQTCWGNTWDEAVARGANFAAAFIIPRCRAGRRGPWAGWHGRVLPPHLLDDFERAGERTHRRRYDEALGDYYLALERDPKNLEIRLRIGYVEEKLGFALGALAHYQAIVKLVERDRWRRRRKARRVLRLARYRRAVVLGAADQLVSQWTADDQETPGAARRAELRELMRPSIVDLCKLAYGEDAEWLTRLLAEPNHTRWPRLLRRVFQRAALHALEELAPRGWHPALRTDDTSLTPTAVRLSRECVQIRLDGLKYRGEDQVARANARLRRAGWNARRRRRGTWGERYNAASLYSLVIAGTEDLDSIDTLASAAVQELERAVLHAESGYVASRREWLTSEDPDLDALRSKPGAREWFDRFEAAFLPTMVAVCKRPERVHEWEAHQYVRRLVTDCAKQRAALWREWRTTTALDRWLEEETRIWRSVAAVAEDCQDWIVRRTLIDAVSAAARAHGWPPPRLAYPRYAELPQIDDVNVALLMAEERLDRVYAIATEAGGESNGSAESHAVAWESIAAALDEPQVPASANGARR